MPDLKELLERFQQKDRLALARLLSLVARGEQVQGVAAAMGDASAPRVVAITGSAGVGKSTLIGKLIECIRKQNRKVAVLACDPQSPLSGGALLGDRFRMPSRAEDDGVFIRSLAALSGHGAVADHLPLMTKLLGAFGFDIVLIETVGAGQGDVTVSDLADVVVLLLQPETGDDLQWEKAGVLEVADIIAVQKADLPGAEHVAAQVRSALELAEKPPVPVVLTSAKTGKGVQELWQAITSAAPRQHANNNSAHELLLLAQETLAKRFAAIQTENNAKIAELCERWHRGRLTSEEAGEAVIELLR